jgi:hypothetical protein
MAAERLDDLTKNKTNKHPSVDRSTEATAEDFKDIGDTFDNHAAILDLLTGASSPNKNYGVYTSLSLLQATHPVGEANSYAIIDLGSGTTTQIATWNNDTSTWDLGTPNEYVVFATTFAALPTLGSENKIYITLNDFNAYVWKNSNYNNININNPLLQLKSEKNLAFGYAGLDELLKINPNFIPDLPISRITNLQTFIDTINQLLASDDVSLDELQEVVTFIKANRDDLANLTIPNIAGLTDALSLLLNKSISEHYTDIADLYQNQPNQKEKLIYFVADASGHSLVESGYAYFEKLGTLNSNETDYRLISKEVIVSNVEFKLLFKTASTDADFKIHKINPLITMKWLIIDNATGNKLAEGSGNIEANMSASSGDSSVFIEVDENGLGITSFVSFYGDGKITFFDFNVVPKLEIFTLYTVVSSQVINFIGLPIKLKELILYGGAVQGFDLSQSSLLESLTISGSITLDTELDISNSSVLKKYANSIYSVNLNVSNHRLLEYLQFKDTVATGLDANINTTYLPNLTTLVIGGNNYYSLDLSVRDLSKIIKIDVKISSIIGFNNMAALKYLYIKVQSTDLVFTGMQIETLSIKELPNTILDLKPLNTLRSFSLSYADHPNLSDIYIDNGNNGLLTKFNRLYVSQGYSGGGDGIVNVKVDNPTDANNEVSPYLPTVWKKQYNGYDVLNFI